MAAILKSTDYCDLLKQGKVVDGDSVYAIEEIIVKDKGEKEIRFAYYKVDAEGNEKFVPRPLDLKENDLLTLLGEGIKEGIISRADLHKL